MINKYCDYSYKQKKQNRVHVEPLGKYGIPKVEGSQRPPTEGSQGSSRFISSMACWAFLCTCTPKEGPKCKYRVWKYYQLLSQSVSKVPVHVEYVGLLCWESYIVVARFPILRCFDPKGELQRVGKETNLKEWRTATWRPEDVQHDFGVCLRYRNSLTMLGTTTLVVIEASTVVGGLPV